MLNADDPALKASFYRRFEPWKLPDWLQRLLADGERYYMNAVSNERIWRDPSERERLRELAWNLPDPNSDMTYPNDYLGFEKRHRNQHPEWFADEGNE